MSLRSSFVTLLAATLLAALLPAAPIPSARAEDLVVDTVLGARLTGTLDAEDVHAFRIPLRAGTELRLELRARNEAGEVEGTEEDDGADLPAESAFRRGGGGPRPLLVLLDPSLAEVGSVRADDRELRVTAAQAGVWRIEVRADGQASGYELRIEGRAPGAVGGRVRTRIDIGAAPTVVHVPAPAPSVVEIEVRRRSGADPEVVSITDALGRPLSVFVKDVRANRIRLENVPVGVEGGLDVAIAGAGGAAGVAEFRARVRPTPDRPLGGDDRESRRIVVLLAPGADAATVAADLGFTLVEVTDRLAVMETPPGREGLEDHDAGAAALAAGVLGAEPDHVGGLPEGSQANAVVVGSEFGRSEMDSQPALGQIRAPAAHLVTRGASTVVAVLDGGFEAAHPALAGRLLPGRDFVDGDLDPADATDGVDEDADGLTDEGLGHGTFVASLVLAAAPDAKVLPVRVLGSDGRGRVSDIASGITWAVEQGADVVNLSFGMHGGSTTLAAAVRYALARGVSVVASSGNDGTAGAVTFPSAMPGVVGVTSLTDAGRRAPFANGARSVWIGAPGESLLGAYPGGRSATWSGTSFSAALVSGGAALAVSRAPSAAPSRIAGMLAGRARPLPRAVRPAQRRLLGAGTLDLERLVR